MTTLLLSYPMSEDLQLTWMRNQEIQRVFYPHVPVYDRHITEMSYGERANIAKARNSVIEHAIQKGYDWVVLLDVDHVLVTPVTVFPSTGFGFVPIHRYNYKNQKSPHQWKLNRWELTSSFIIHKDLFSVHRYREEFEGYGYEDVEFRERMADGGVFMSGHDMRAVHVHHDPRPWTLREPETKKIYDRISYERVNRKPWTDNSARNTGCLQN